MADSSRRDPAERNPVFVFHQARWLAKIIYSIKIFLFQDQLHLTAAQKAGIKTFVNFAIQVYLRAWYTAPLSTSAPRNDLELIKRIQAFVGPQKVISEALRSISRHLWYLGHELVGLSFYDEEVSQDEKVKMVESLEKTMDSSSRLRAQKLPNSLALNNFVNSGTKNFFKKLGVSSEFLCLPPESWEDDSGYKAGKKIAIHLKVVNDAAERGVALIQDLITRTKDEKQLQHLVNVVQTHRKMFPSVKKSDLL